MPFSLAILTGGKSKRFGFNKCSYKFSEKTMIEMLFCSVKNLFDEVLFVGEDLPPHVKLSGKTIHDLHPNKGPVGGLEAALISAKNEFVFLVACDMPFVSREVVSKVIENSKSYDIVCPFVDNKYQTTHAIYSKDILPIVKKELKREKSTLTHIVLTTPNTLFLEEENFWEIPDFRKSFKNFNSFKEIEEFKEKHLC